MNRQELELAKYKEAQDFLNVKVDTSEELYIKKRVLNKLYKLIEDQKPGQDRDSLIRYFEKEVKELKIADNLFDSLLNFLTTINKKTTYKDLYLFVKDYVLDPATTQFPHPYTKNKLIGYLVLEYRRQATLRGYTTNLNNKSFKSSYEKEVQQMPLNMFIARTLLQKGLPLPEDAQAQDDKI